MTRLLLQALSAHAFMTSQDQARLPAGDARGLEDLQCLKKKVNKQLEDIAPGEALRCRSGYAPQYPNDVCIDGKFEGGCLKMCLEKKVKKQLENIAEGFDLRCKPGFAPEDPTDRCTDGAFSSRCLPTQTSWRREYHISELLFEPRCSVHAAIACCSKGDFMGPEDFTKDDGTMNAWTKKEAKEQCKKQQKSMCRLSQVKTYLSDRTPNQEQNQEQLEELTKDHFWTKDESSACVVCSVVAGNGYEQTTHTYLPSGDNSFVVQCQTGYTGPGTATCTPLGGDVVASGCVQKYQVYSGISRNWTESNVVVTFKPRCKAYGVITCCNSDGQLSNPPGAWTYEEAELKCPEEEELCTLEQLKEQLPLQKHWGIYIKQDFWTKDSQPCQAA